MSRGRCLLLASIIFQLSTGESCPVYAKKDERVKPKALQLNFLSQQTVPCTVQITGPKNFKEEASKLIPTKRYPWGPGLSVDWGDGSKWPEYGLKTNAPARDVSITQHTYTVAGTYKISAKLYHRDASDLSVTDWLGEATVVIANNATAQTNTKGSNVISKDSLALEILSPNATDVFSYQEFPTVKWRLSTDRQVRMKLQLLDSQNNLIGQDEHKSMSSISYNVPEQQRRMHPASFKAYEKSISSGNRKFKVKAIVFDQNEQPLLSKETAIFTMTNELKSDKLRLRDEFRRQPLQAGLSYDSNHSEDVSYILDWGDGSPVTSLIRPVPLKNSALSPKRFTFSHTYLKPGKYLATIKSNDDRIFNDLKEIPYYEAATIEVSGK